MRAFNTCELCYEFTEYDNILYNETIFYALQVFL